jgi:ferredoxin
MAEGAAVIDPAVCQHCEICVDTCPEGAITAIVEKAPGIPAAIPTTSSQMGIITADHTVRVEESGRVGKETTGTSSRIANIFAGIGNAVIPVLVENFGSMVDMWLKQHMVNNKESYEHSNKQMSQSIDCRMRSRGGGLRIQRRQQSGKRKKQRLGGKNAW